MPCKKKKYNARFPAGRIKKIMQSDEEIGKVAQAVPVVISRTLELFVESLLKKTLKITVSRNAKTLSTSHMKQCIMAEQRFDFLRELVKNIPDISVAEEAANYNEDDGQSSAGEMYADADTPYDLSMPSTSAKASQISNGSDTLYSNKRNFKELFQSNNFTEERDQHKREGNALHSLQLNIGTLADQRLQGEASSVIMHTASVNATSSNYFTPKLQRSESLPINATSDSNWKDSNTNNLRVQSRASKSPANFSINHLVPTTKVSKQELLQNPAQAHTQLHLPMPLPAPIVGLEFYNKPVVKIEYSHLPVPHATEGLTRDVNKAKTVQAKNNVQIEPVINIDLSNIVAPAYNQSKSAVDALSINATASCATKSKLVLQSPALPCNTTANTMFELDEDYDNI